jgi:hypothetical protein
MRKTFYFKTTFLSKKCTGKINKNIVYFTINSIDEEINNTTVPKNCNR